VLATGGLPWPGWQGSCSNNCVRTLESEYENRLLKRLAEFAHRDPRLASLQGSARENCIRTIKFCAWRLCHPLNPLNPHWLTASRKFPWERFASVPAYIRHGMRRVLRSLTHYRGLSRPRERRESTGSCFGADAPGIKERTLNKSLAGEENHAPAPSLDEARRAVEK